MQGIEVKRPWIDHAMCKECHWRASLSVHDASSGVPKTADRRACATPVRQHGVIVMPVDAWPTVAAPNGDLWLDESKGIAALKTQTRREFLAVASAAAALPLVPTSASAQASGAAQKASGLEYRTAEALLAALASRQISAVELTNNAIARIEFS